MADSEAKEVPALSMLQEDPAKLWLEVGQLRKEAAEGSPDDLIEVIAAFAQKRSEGGSVIVLTNRSDELFQRAGCSEVVQLCGSVFTSRCTSSRCELTPFRDEESHEDDVPACPLCSSRLRPDLLLAGEEIDGRVEWHAKRALKACQMFIVVGDSDVLPKVEAYLSLAGEHNARTVMVTPRTLGPGVAAERGFSDERVGELAQVLAQLLG